MTEIRREARPRGEDSWSYDAYANKLKLGPSVLIGVPYLLRMPWNS